MAHSIVKGIDRMASTRLDTVWHATETAADGRLVQVPATDDLEATLLTMGGIVWPTDADNDVHRTGELEVRGEGTLVTTHKAMLSRSGRVLGVVGSGYQAVPFTAIFTDWLLALARAGGAPETLGTFDAGANFFAAFQVAPAWRVSGDDHETRPFCNVVANHTGNGGIRGSFASFRAVCKNTATMFGREHDQVEDAATKVQRAWVTIAHTANAADRMKDAVAWITDGAARAETERELLERMAAKLLSPTQVDTFVRDYIAIPDGASKQTLTNRMKSRDQFYADMQAADLGNHGIAGGEITAYGLFQAVTHFEDWTSGARNSDDAPVGTRRAFRAFLGKREAEKSTARERILAMVS
jgi:phage/plasmid-like protein (TIGR03299 family)